MDQSEARRIAKAINSNTDMTAVADTIRKTGNGRLVKGGWPHKDQTWAVYQANTVLFPVEYRNEYAFEAPLEETLRRTEAEIAGWMRRCPREYKSEYGLTPGYWEKIRQWPGEYIEPQEDE